VALPRTRCALNASLPAHDASLTLGGCVSPQLFFPGTYQRRPALSARRVADLSNDHPRR